MLQIIKITVEDESYNIRWALSEHFEELKGKTSMLNELVAEQIEKINDLSIIAKILLSAVAGAVIQYLIDKELQFDVILNNGKFVVVN
ncbi:MAG: hypothetical protein ACLTEH_02700 [Clostridia bacterium]